MQVKHTLVMTGIKQTVIVILLMRASRIHRFRFNQKYIFSKSVKSVWYNKMFCIII